MKRLNDSDQPSARLLALLQDATFQTPGTLGPTDRSLIKESIILPMVMTIINRNYKRLDVDGIRLKKVYLVILQKAMDSVLTDLTAIKQELRKRQIKVYLESRDAEGIRTLYLYKGYTDRSFFRWNYIKVEVEKRISAYLSYPY